MIDNKNLMAKADLEVSDLIADGGYLLADQSKKFIVDAIKQSVVLKMIKVEGIKSHTKMIPKVGLNGRVLRPGTSGVALSAADRAKPVTDEVTLTTKLMKGEIRLNDETLEDQVEGGQFKTTVMNMMTEQVALDLDELTVNGDTTSTDTFLAQFNGLLALATSHVVNAGTVPLAKSHLKAALKAMPSQYNRNRAQQRFMTSEDGELDYRDYLADRSTALGDKLIQDDSALRYGNRAILPIPVFPDNLGIATDCTNVLLTDPKNAYFGFYRKVKIDTDRDITTGEWIMVATVRCGLQYVEEDAVVKITNVKTQ